MQRNKCSAEEISLACGGNCGGNISGLRSDFCGGINAPRVICTGDEMLRGG